MSKYWFKRGKRFGYIPLFWRGWVAVLVLLLVLKIAYWNFKMGTDSQNVFLFSIVVIFVLTLFGFFAEKKCS